MNEEQFLKLRVLEKTEEMLEEKVEVETKHFEYAHQTNPIYRNLVKFHNEEAPKKWSIRDLLR
ncbi:hypothetical protein KBA27_01175 [bacterium]|nr:hypothetical protein [bacterium]